MKNNQLNTSISNTPKELIEGKYATIESKGIEEKKYSEKDINHMRKLFPVVAMTYRYNPARMHIDALLKEKNIYVTIEYNSAPKVDQKIPKVWNHYKVFKDEICVFDAEDNLSPRKINDFTIGEWEEEFLDCIKQSKELYDNFYTTRSCK